MKTSVRLNMLSPLLHYGDERAGTEQIHRTMKFKYKDEFIDIPIYSGNAFRGQIRRVAMKDYLERLGLIDEGVTAKLYYLLFSGGAMTSGSRYNEIGNKRNIRDMCPPISLLGTAIGDQVFEGKLKVGIFKPICKETEQYTGIQSEISFYDMLQGIFYTRKDDLNNKDFNLTDDEKYKNPVQMKYEIQCLSAGTELLGSLIIENGSSIEESCLKATLERLKEMPYIGGKSATGHGEVALDYNIDVETDLYYNYLEQNKDSMREWLREVEGLL